MSPGQVNLLVFREDRGSASGVELKSVLTRDIQSSSRPQRLLRALLRAGELECGVADAAPELLPDWEHLTDKLADALFARKPLPPDIFSTLVGQAQAPTHLAISKPEGFACYGLHPLAYAELIEELGPLPPQVAVIGIRSIGTTLSAVTAAAARRRGAKATRITVRPAGHPYNRHTRFTPRQLAWVEESLGWDAAFLVVDEGPGLSGSSFISVAEALVEAGVPAEKITLICGHDPDFPSLRSDDAPQRAGRFCWVAVDNQPRVPGGAEVFIGGGEWRHTLAPELDWPASWTSMERLKYLSYEQDGHRQLFKFAGLGHYGDEVIERERELAAAGFGPWAEYESEGFAGYRWLRGRPMQSDDRSPSSLLRLAQYCALRARVFPAGSAEPGPLQEMAEHNLEQLGFDRRLTLRIERPVVPDGRMQPHEWLLTPDSQMLKTDSGSHGDDHFFPGPTDIAWDLAGAIVEWRMDAGQMEFFLESYRRAGGDDARARIPEFLKAYSVFRCAYCLMAANALQGSDEQSRLERAAAGYQMRLRAGSSAVTGPSGFSPVLSESC